MAERKEEQEPKRLLSLINVSNLKTNNRNFQRKGAFLLMKERIIEHTVILISNLRIDK